MSALAEWLCALHPTSLPGRFKSSNRLASQPRVCIGPQFSSPRRRHGILSGCGNGGQEGSAILKALRSGDQSINPQSS